MNKIKDLYQKLWKSLILPERIYYELNQIGCQEQWIGNTYYKREDVNLSTILDIIIHASLFLPDLGVTAINDNNSSQYNLTLSTAKSFSAQKFDVVVYMHTHSGTRVQGMDYLEYVAAKKMGYC